MFEELSNLLSTISTMIPDGTVKEVNMDNFNLHIENKDGKVVIKIDEKEFNDSEIKDTVAKFKNKLAALDDCLFVEVIEALGEDSKEYNDLLEQDSYTAEEADEVCEVIDTMTEIIIDKLDRKIAELEDLRDRF